MSFADGFESSRGRSPSLKTLSAVSPSSSFGGLDEWTGLHKKVVTSLNEMGRSLPESQRLLKVLGSANDTQEIRQQLRTQLNNAQRTVHEVGEAVKRMQMLFHDSNSEDQRDRKVILDKVLRDYAVRLQEFKNINQLWMSHERKSTVGSQYDGGFNSFYSQAGADRSDETSSLLSGQSRQVYAVDSDVEFQERIIAEREREINKIESAMVEVNDIFRDLGIIVEEQQVMVDSIENHIEHAVDNSNKGVKELESAKRIQKKTGSKIYMIAILCVLILIAIVAVAVIVAVLST